MSEELKAAQARIACLEGEIAKRDEELAACRIAVENCELFRARIAEIEADRDSHQRCAIQAMAELAAIKAQEPVSYTYASKQETQCAGCGIRKHTPLRVDEMGGYVCLTCIDKKLEDFYAAPVSEAKAQGVVMPDVNAAAKALCNRHAMICGVDADDQWKEYSQDFIADAETVLANARLNAAPAAPAADAGLVDMYRHLQTVTPYRFKKIQDASVTDGGDVLYFHKDRFDAALLDDMAANCAKESK